MPHTPVEQARRIPSSTSLGTIEQASARHHPTPKSAPRWCASSDGAWAKAQKNPAKKSLFFIRNATGNLAHDTACARTRAQPANGTLRALRTSKPPLALSPPSTSQQHQIPQKHKPRPCTNPPYRFPNFGPRRCSPPLYLQSIRPIFTPAAPSVCCSTQNPRAPKKPRHNKMDP